MSDITFSFKSTNVLLSVLDKMFKSRIQVEGVENLVDQPTLFVVNHFTRAETFLLPYIIYQQKKQMVHSLADHTLFKGRLGQYLHSLGAISTREPFRNRKIISELMTGKHNWVIFPEGIMVKNKKMFDNGKLVINSPDRKGPPHTGAAVLALKAGMFKREYRKALENDDEETLQRYQDRFGFTDADQLSPQGIVITPVNITYYPIRPENTILSNIAKYFIKDMPQRVDEELTTELPLLLNDTDIHVRFLPNIPLDSYLDRPFSLCQKFLPFISEEKRADLILWFQKYRLTRHFMKSIYENITINFDHIFCLTLKMSKGKVFIEDDFKLLLYLSARKITQHADLKSHPSLKKGLMNLVSDCEYKPYDSIYKLAHSEGVITRGDSGQKMTIYRRQLTRKIPFHRVRLKSMIRVLANEIEPQRQVISLVNRLTNLSTEALKSEVVKDLVKMDLDHHEADYKKYYDKKLSRPIEVGRPFFLKSKKSQVGVLLSHGYLAAPEEVRELAEYLHEKGYTVYGIRLKGHGTAPRELAEVGVEQWIESFELGYSIIKNTCRHVILGGFSAGGLLALLNAARKKDRILGVFCVNAALKLGDIRSRLVPSVVLWNDLLDKFNIEKGKLKKITNDTESPEINYTENYLRGVRELGNLISQCKSQLGEIVAPTLIIQGDQDPVVDPSSAEQIATSIKSADVQKFITPSTRHVIVRGEGSEKVRRRIHRFIKRIVQASVDSKR